MVHRDHTEQTPAALCRTIPHPWLLQDAECTTEQPLHHGTVWECFCCAIHGQQGQLSTLLSSPCSSDRAAGSPVRLVIYHFYHYLSLLSKAVEDPCLQCTQASSQSALAAPWPYNLISPTCRGVCDWCTLHSPSQHSCPQAGTRSHKHGHSWTTDSSRFFPVTTTSINNQGFFLSFVVCIMWHLNSLYTNSSSALIVCFCTVIN